MREKADLLCLQEVDCFQQLTEHLQPKGYSGVWVPKPWSPCLKFPGNQGPDGNAVFFRREVFTFLSSHSRILELQSGELSGSTVGLEITPISNSINSILRRGLSCAC